MESKTLPTTPEGIMQLKKELQTWLDPQKKERDKRQPPPHKNKDIVSKIIHWIPDRSIEETHIEILLGKLRRNILSGKATRASLKGILQETFKESLFALPRDKNYIRGACIHALHACGIAEKDIHKVVGCKKTTTANEIKLRKLPPSDRPAVLVDSYFVPVSKAAPHEETKEQEKPILPTLPPFTIAEYKRFLGISGFTEHLPFHFDWVNVPYMTRRMCVLRVLGFSSLQVAEILGCPTSLVRHELGRLGITYMNPLTRFTLYNVVTLFPTVAPIAIQRHLFPQYGCTLASITEAQDNMSLSAASRILTRLFTSARPNVCTPSRLRSAFEFAVQQDGAHAAILLATLKRADHELYKQLRAAIPDFVPKRPLDERTKRRLVLIKRAWAHASMYFNNRLPKSIKKPVHSIYVPGLGDAHKEIKTFTRALKRGL